jgi:hypothetical protein
MPHATNSHKTPRSAAVEPVGQRHRSTIRFSAREIVLLLLRRSNDGIVAADKTIKLSPSTSVLKHQVGDEIKLSEQDFVQVPGLIR